jgi:hypothetical protein
MADIITGTTTGVVDTSTLQGEHADIRREASEHTSDIRYNVAERAGDIRRELADVKDVLNDSTRVEGGQTRFQGAANTSEIIKEGLKESFAARGDTKDSRNDVLREVDRQADRLDNQATQFYIANQAQANEAARDLASLKVLTDMNMARTSNEIQAGIAAAAAATALESQKVATAVALGQATLSKEIFADGQKTRDLINDLKYHDLNRALVERNAELVEERESRRHWRYAADMNQNQGQWSALQSQLQAFQSQLQETRQGMVNFGTMAGVGQSSTSNNVR